MTPTYLIIFKFRCSYFTPHIAPGLRTIQFLFYYIRPRPPCMHPLRLRPNPCVRQGMKTSPPPLPRSQAILLSARRANRKGHNFKNCTTEKDRGRAGGLNPICRWIAIGFNSAEIDSSSWGSVLHERFRFQISLMNRGIKNVRRHGSKRTV
jgi:hypothetical protein